MPHDQKRVALLEAVAEAGQTLADACGHPIIPGGKYAQLYSALAALAAHDAAHTREPKEDGETVVRLAVWVGPNGGVLFSIPGSQDYSVPPRWTRLGVVTLPTIPTTVEGSGHG